MSQAPNTAERESAPLDSLEVSQPPVGAAPDVPGEGDTAGLADVKQLGLVAAIASLSYVFWVCGGMEMVERLAFYGVKANAMLYVTDAVAHGGLGATPTMYGVITGVWAWTQSLVPVFTGGLSDRYGYKETIFVSTVVKISGYLTMAFFPTFAGFFTGAILLATGTAIFKPGIQGTLVNSTKRENSSMAWGIFYQTVNIGGWIGPALAVYMKHHFGWRYVFLVCALAICCNFLLLVTYKEPGKELRLARQRAQKASGYERDSLAIESVRELVKPHVWIYLLIFSGFWFMFNALFDVLPLHIADWVDTRDIVQTLFGGQAHNPVAKFLLGMNEDGTSVDPAGMLNLNAGLIMATCFLFAWVSGKMRATTSMVVGTLLASLAMFLSGFSVAGLVSAGAILVFSMGEMLSSPKFSEFIGNFAPAGKKAMYLGFSQIPLAVGWGFEGFVAPALYDRWASKERFAREMLVARGMPAAQVDAIKQGEAFQALVSFTHDTPEHLTHVLRESHNIGALWILMGAIGVVTAVGIYLYGRWVRTLVKS